MNRYWMLDPRYSMEIQNPASSIASLGEKIEPR